MKIPKIKKFKIKELKAAGYNPRVINNDALEGLANSIERFGCVEPIVVNTRGGVNTIIGGHQRLRALEKLDALDKVKPVTRAQWDAIQSAQNQFRHWRGFNLGELLNLFDLPPEERK